MRILFIAHNTHLLGATKAMLSVLQYFKEQGVDIHLLLPNKKGLYEEVQKEGITVHVFLFFWVVLYVKWNIKYLSLPILWLYNLIASPFLLYKIRKINPDMIYCNTSLEAYSIWFAKILHKKHITHVREFGFEDFGARYILGRKMKCRYLLLSDKLIFVSMAVAKAVVNHVPPCGRVIYDGVSRGKSTTIKPLDVNLRIGVVGNIDISKQQDLAIKYMAEITKKYPNITLHIIGDKKCPYRKYIHQLVKDLHLENNVVFEGFIYDTEEIYNRLDVLLMCSRSEAFGLVTIEAMLRSKPVIGFDRGGTSELIEDGVTGFKFMTCADVIKALDFMIEHPKETVIIVETARNRAEIMFNEERYVKDVYKYVTKNWS